jgi:hypothetical protein
MENATSGFSGLIFNDTNTNREMLAVESTEGRPVVVDKENGDDGDDSYDDDKEDEDVIVDMAQQQEQPVEDDVTVGPLLHIIHSRYVVSLTHE